MQMTQAIFDATIDFASPWIAGSTRNLRHQLDWKRADHATYRTIPGIAVSEIDDAQ